MLHQIYDLICQCEDGKYRLKSNSIDFEDKWYEPTYIEEETTIYEDTRYWKDDCKYSDYLEGLIPIEIFDENHFYCSGCELYFHNQEKSHHYYDNDSFCEDCFHNSYTYCYNCDDAVRNSNSHYSEITGNDYCESCFYDYHGYCERCEDNYWLEDGCNCSSHIHRYSYKPNPIFFKTQKEKPKFYIGIELETESKGNSIPDCAEEVSSISNLLYLKNDGSLDNGFEVVTHPLTYNWYLENKSIFNELLVKLKDNGFRSYNTSTCGIHIHITKNYLSGLDIAKLHLFFYQNEDFIAQISQR